MPFTRTPTPRELRQDLLLAAVLLVGGILSAGLSSLAKVYGSEQGPLWTAIPYVVVISAAIALRRRWPGPVAVVVSLAFVVATSLKVPEIYAGNIAMFIALYTVGAWMNARRSAFFVRVGIMVVMAAWLVVEMYRQAIDQAAKADVVAGMFSPLVAFLMLQVLLNVLYFGGAYYFGERSWSAARQRAALEQRTEELERERALSAAQAVALDRVRIARELHDVVAHHVSVMGVQAGAARMMIPQDPQAATEIVAGIETSARDAIRDFRQLLDTLRAPGDSEDVSSTVDIGDIAELAAASTSAGLPTRLQVIGEPVPVPRVTAVNLYRIAQESLTNARRHAGPDAEADVRIRYEPGSVELEVVNTGRVVTGLRPGLGQLGMRERATASGGTIELVPRPAGGFRVRATLPVTSASASAYALADAPAGSAPRRGTEDA
ncbi:sensor histidine kinase [Microbacterium azadirachtae]|uniref:sensor histidine kinase n=1 Tax=Microbacterium azadirachtae TaxID=582680 RepID=UPI000892345A|nr:sensor histidine kinase [Microbacterium azadirachtae]SDL76609.1 Signal transduction histidine kinase [Microbacterium azadirachtae]SEG05822.1 Signal transduction histidine kinase [Microbacterium azadirachtae]SEG08388.1 Signal transduction histidine kinase [Microbacterium azadirachtae]